MITKLRDLMKISSLKDAKILAGADCLDKTVTWVCPAKVADFDLPLSGGEIVTIARTEKLSDPEKELADMFESCVKGRAPAIAVSFNEMYLKEIPASVLQYAEQSQLAVIEIPWSVHMMNFQKEANRFIVKSNTVEGLPSDVIHGLMSESMDDILLALNRAESYGYPVVGNYRTFVVYFRPLHSDDNECSDIAMINDEYIVKTIDSTLRSMVKKYCIYFVNKQLIVNAWYEQESTKADAALLAEKLQQRVQSYFEKDFRVSLGVSDNHANLAHFARARLEAIRAIEIDDSGWSSGSVFYYEDMGFAKLLFGIEKKKVLQDYYNTTLAPLLEYDSQNGGILIDTLRCYASNGFQAEKTAEVMFIHKNTLRYRLKKIEEILGGSFSDYVFASNLIAALRIERIIAIYNKLE